MIEDIMPFAWKAYQAIGHALGINAISQKSIIDFFPNPFMRESFLQKIETGDHMFMLTRNKIISITFSIMNWVAEK
jgi:hypothetical protein